MKRYLTIQEAAEFLNVTTQTLRNWDRLKKFKPHRHPMNNYRLYTRTELQRLRKRIEK